MSEDKKSEKSEQDKQEKIRAEKEAVAKPGHVSLTAENLTVKPGHIGKP